MRVYKIVFLSRAASATFLHHVVTAGLPASAARRGCTEFRCDYYYAKSGKDEEVVDEVEEKEEGGGG